MTRFHTRKAGQVLFIWIEHPPHNFIDALAVDELYELVRTVDADSSIRAVVIGAQGWPVHADPRMILQGLRRSPLPLSYSSGRAAMGLISALARVPGAHITLTRTRLSGLVTIHRLEEVYATIERSDKIWIAAISDICFGAATALALACDIRLATDGGRPIGLPETVLGIIPTTAVTRAVHSLGRGKAIELLLEGRALSPEEAVEVGLVHRVVSAEALEAEAVATAQRLIRRSPQAVREIKRVCSDGATRRLASGLAVERASFLAASSATTTTDALDALVGDLESAEDDEPSERLLHAWRRAIQRSL